MKKKHIALLIRTSRTFSLPILRAPRALRDAIGSAYLCMRAIDQIEDHETLPREAKIRLLRGIAAILRQSRDTVDRAALAALFRPHAGILEEVSLLLADVAEEAPAGVRRLIWDSTADMAADMACWVDAQWAIRSEADLDAYTYSVAGRVGVLLSDLWRWFDGTVCDEQEAIGFGRALQAVNIVRNGRQDRDRGVDFYPPGWDQPRMMTYAWRQVSLADRYLAKLPRGPVRDFCAAPLLLAKATLQAIQTGREKLNREEVKALMCSLEST